MKERKKELNHGRSALRLTAARRERHPRTQKTKAEKLRIWYRIYLATTLGTVLLAAALLVAGLCETDLLRIPRGEELATLFLRGEFSDISGDLKSYGADNGSQNTIFDIMNGIMIPSKDQNDSNSIIVPDKGDAGDKSNTSSSPGSIYDFDYSKVPDGETAVIPMDLSLSSYGASYIYNSTGYTPNAAALMTSKLSFSDDPVQN